MVLVTHGGDLPLLLNQEEHGPPQDKDQSITKVSAEGSEEEAFLPTNLEPTRPPDQLPTHTPVLSMRPDSQPNIEPDLTTQATMADTDMDTDTVVMADTDTDMDTDTDTDTVDMVVADMEDADTVVMADTEDTITLTRPINTATDTSQRRNTQRDTTKDTTRDPKSDTLPTERLIKLISDGQV